MFLQGRLKREVNYKTLPKAETVEEYSKLDHNKVFFTMVAKTGTSGFRRLIRKMARFNGINHFWQHLRGNHSRQKTLAEQARPGFKTSKNNQYSSC